MKTKEHLWQHKSYIGTRANCGVNNRAGHQFPRPGYWSVLLLAGCKLQRKIHENNKNIVINYFRVKAIQLL